MRDRKEPAHEPADRRGRGWLRVTALVAVALIVGAGIGWAGRTLLAPPPDVPEDIAYTSAVVEQGSVGASLTLNAAAQWTSTPTGINRAAGTVTSVAIEQGAEVSAGTTLYTVDARPVVVAEGSWPAYRTIELGATGTDVEQVQRLLAATGHLSGTADGRAGPGTVAAIRAWQRSLGVEPTGQISVGDIIFLPSLPARVVLDATTHSIGMSVGGGEQSIGVLPTAPVVTISVTAEQAAGIPAGTRVALDHDSLSWQGRVTTQQQSDDGGVQLVVGTDDGSPVCGDACDAIPLQGRTLIPTRVTLVDDVEGLRVPISALGTGADGEPQVIDDAGTPHAVQVIASANGMAIVEGVEAGTRVRVPSR